MKEKKVKKEKKIKKVEKVDKIKKAPGKKGNNKKKTVIKIVVAAVLLLAVALGCVYYVKNYTGINGGVRCYFNAMKTGAGAEGLTSYSPEYEKAAPKYKYVYDKQIKEESIRSRRADWEQKYGIGYQLSYKITNQVDLSQEELDQVKGAIQTTITEKQTKYDINKIKAAKEVTVEYTVTGSKLTETQTQVFLFIKEGSQWNIYSRFWDIEKQGFEPLF